MNEDVEHGRTFRIRHVDEDRCRVVGDGGETLEVVRAREYGGEWNGFSSTDLVAVALGTCIATSIEPLLERHGIDPGAVEMDVEKTLAKKPRGIAGIAVVVRLPPGISDAVRTRVARAASSCVVSRLLHGRTEVQVRVL